MSEENLSRGIRRIIDITEDPRMTINLKDLAPGDQLFVKVGDEPEDLLDFVIVTPAKEKCTSFDDSARALLPGWKWSSRCTEKEVKILIGGSCTYNPGSALGMTMLSIGRLSVGRNFIIFLDGTDNAVIFKKPIQQMTVKRSSESEHS